MPDVSVIIVNWNGKGLLRDCLRSLRSCTLELETIVVDNGSRDGSVAMIRREYPDVRVIEYDRNERFAKPNNHAMRIATGRFLFLLNNDTMVHPGAIERLIDVLSQHPGVGMVGAQLIGIDGKTQESCHGIVTPLTHLFDISGLDRLFPHSRFFASGPASYTDYSQSQEVDHVMAAAVLVRREAIEAVGVFDEKLTIYYNDLDWSVRFRKSGWTVRYEPEARITHLGGATTRVMRSDQKVISEQYDNIMYYFRKHYGVAGLIGYRLFLCAGFVPRVAYWTLMMLVDQSEEHRWRWQFAAWSVRIALLGS